MARGAIKFDLSNIGISADEITKAELSFYFFFGQPVFPTDTDICTLYTITKDWEESSITWNNAKSGSAWDKPGGDFNSTPIATKKCERVNKWETYDVTDAVKNMVANPSSNHGFLLAVPHDNTGRSYWSSEYDNEGDKSLRPKLTITPPISIRIGKFTNQLIKGIRITNTPGKLKFFIPLNRKYSVGIFTVKGKKLASFTGSNAKWFETPVEVFPSGTYFLRINADNSTGAKKFVLLR